MTSQGSNDDCYFYYYSSCTKGDSCPFRHCEAALGTETVCNQWREGLCFRENCMFRHMESRINRSTIPCYWENQPTGCCKPHCVFMHLKRRSPASSITENKKLILPVSSNSSPVNVTAKEVNIPEKSSNPLATASSVDNFSSPSEDDIHLSPHPVEPFVVRFDENEESDSESVSSTPMKFTISDSKSNSASVKRNILDTLSEKEDFGIKTLEQIRMEKIHKESEHFYKSNDATNAEITNASGVNRNTSLGDKMLTYSAYDAPLMDSTQMPDMTYETETYPPVSDFISLSDSPTDKSSSRDSNLLSTEAESDLRNRLLKRKGICLFKEKATVPIKKAALSLPNKEDSLNFKIKTLEEIRKERENKSSSNPEKTSVSKTANSELEIDSSKLDVSTSNGVSVKGTRRIYLKRIMESGSKNDDTEGNCLDQNTKPEVLSETVLHEVQNISEGSSLTITIKGKRKESDETDVSTNPKKVLKSCISSSVSKSSRTPYSSTEVLSASLNSEGTVKKLRRPIIRRNVIEESSSVSPATNKKFPNDTAKQSTSIRRNSKSPPSSTENPTIISSEINGSSPLSKNTVSLSTNITSKSSNKTGVPSVIRKSVVSAISPQECTVPNSPTNSDDTHHTVKKNLILSAPSSKISISKEDKDVKNNGIHSSSKDSKVENKSAVAKVSPVEVPQLKKNSSFEVIDKIKKTERSASEDDIENFLLNDTDLTLDDVDEAPGKDTDALMSEIEQLLDS